MERELATIVILDKDIVKVLIKRKGCLFPEVVWGSWGRVRDTLWEIKNKQPKLCQLTEEQKEQLHCKLNGHQCKTNINWQLALIKKIWSTKYTYRNTYISVYFVIFNLIFLINLRSNSVDDFFWLKIITKHPSKLIIEGYFPDNYYKNTSRSLTLLKCRSMSTQNPLWDLLKLDSTFHQWSICLIKVIWVAVQFLLCKITLSPIIWIL